MAGVDKSKEVEKNAAVESASKTVVGPATENGDEISKDSTDGGISLSKSDSDPCETNVKTSEIMEEKAAVNECSQAISEKSSDASDKSCVKSKSCSPEKAGNSCSSTQSSSASASEKSDPGSSRRDDDDDDDDKQSSSSSSTLRGSQNVNNDDEDSRSSTSTVKNSQPSKSNDSDDESNSRVSSSKQSSQSTVRTSQNTHTELAEDNDSRSSFTSSHSRSTVKRSQSVADRSDDEDSRSSMSNRKSSPNKHSQDTTKSSQSTRTDLTEDTDSRSSITSTNSKSTTKNSQPVIDKSDDDSNSKPSLPVKKSQSPDDKSSKPKKYFSIVDSESEDDIVVPKISFNNENNDSDKSKAKNHRKLFDSDSDDDKKSDNDGEEKNDKSINKSNKFSSIVDSESESDRDQKNNASSGEENDEEKTQKGKKKLQKKRTGSARASKDAAMQQIHSETQRLIRESEVSLPYHRPKQRTLQEFLNRKKISTSIPQNNLTCAEKVKMFSAVISKAVQEKEKEAEEFYKSSDSEEEEEKTDKPMDQDPKIDDKTENKIENNSMDVDPANISDTQKLTQDHIQDMHNKRSFLQQRSSDFGVPRKLFLDDDDPEKIENLTNKDGNLESENIDAVKRHKEFKTGLQEFSVPHKLFTDDVEAMDVCDDTDDTNTAVLEKEKSENKKITEDSNKDEEANGNKNEHESSTEDFVLEMPETEANEDDVKVDKSNKNANQEKVKNEEKIEEMTITKDQESMIAETPFMSNKKYAELNKSAALKDQDTEKEVPEKPEEAKKVDESKSMEETEDIVLEFPKETNEEDEVVDKNMLKDDFFKPPELEEEEEKKEEKKEGKKPSLKQRILANALKSKPTIKALPGSVIDFTSAEQIQEGVTDLIHRFSRHSAVHKHTAAPISEVKVMRTENTDNDITLIEEVLPFNKTLMEDDYTKESKPGEKLKILKEDLKRKIASEKNEAWKQKENHEEDDEEEEKCKGKGDDFYEGLPDEEEELYGEDSAESEPEEEDDIPMVDKKRSTCEFGDEEAEESLDEGCEENEDKVDGDEEEEGEEEEDEEESEEEAESESEKEEETNKGPKKLKRIIKPFDEDDSNDSNASLKKNEAEEKLSLERTKTDEDMFVSQIKSNFSIEDMEGESIPAFVRDRLGSDARSQACKTPLPRHNMVLSMISPVNHLTVLNSSNDSSRKSDAKTPKWDLGRISTENTPLENGDRPPNNCSMEKMMSLQKKLFEDPPETVHDSELLEICSGKFADTQSSEQQKPATQLQPDRQNEVTDSQLMDICSGSFVTQTLNLNKLENESSLQLGDETSQDITLILDQEDEPRHSPTKFSSSMKRSDESMFSSDSKSPVKSFTPKSPIKFKSPIKSAFKSTNPMDAWLKKASAKPVLTQTQQNKPQNEVTDSQLLDICSGAFTSQSVDMKEFETEASQQQKSQVSQDVVESENQSKTIESEFLKKKTVDEQDGEEPNAPWTGFAIASSSDEENKENTSKKKRLKKKVLKKKKVQKLKLSDDEDEEHGEFSDVEEEYEDEEEEDEEKYYDYDSDENEVVVVPKKEIRKVAGKFLENEAELSESEWGSDDENEEDLDKLEYEEGDAEDIDEDQMKDQLDRIHMKQVMDEDQREVRMLQELLFDDGDLHSEGAGRERKFRWKNVDSLGEDDNAGPSLDDNADGFDDDIDVSKEVQLRKMRYEQQKFLEEQEKKKGGTIEDDFVDSQILKSSLKIVSVRSSKTSIIEKKITKPISDTNKNIMTNDLANVVTKKLIMNTKTFSFSNVRGSFLSRGEAALSRIAQDVPELKNPINPNRKRKFVFEHLSPVVAKPQEDSEQENDTPDTDSKKRKRRLILSQQTPTSTKKAKVDDKKSGKRLF